MAVRAARRGLLVASMAAALVLALAVPAHAGGSWFDVIEDSIQPGDTVTLVGYTGGGAYGWIEDGPFFGWLIPAGEDGGGPDPEGIRLPLGMLDVADTGAGGYLRLRASITFQIPSDLEPGVYAFDYCNEACDERLGDLIGGILHVGVEPEHPRARGIPFDDPEFERLADDARVTCIALQTTAGQVRRDEVKPPDWCYLARTQRPDPPIEEPTTTTASGAESMATSTAAAAATSDPTAAESTLADQSPSPVTGDRTETAWLGATSLAGVALLAALGVGWRTMHRARGPRRLPDGAADGPVRSPSDWPPPA